MFDSFRRKLFPQHTGYTSLGEWRQHVFRVLLAALVILATVVATPSIVLALSRGMWHVAVTDGAALALAFVLWRANHLSFHTRAWALCALLYAVGIALLFVTGPASQIYLIASPVMAAIFLGLRPAVSISALNTLTLLLVGYFFNADIQVAGLEGQPLLKWIVIAVNFAFVNGLVSISIGLLLRGLEASMGTVRDSEERFRTAFLTSPDAIIINRLADGTFLEVNEGFLQMLGLKREEIIGKTSKDIHIWSDISARRTLFDIVQREGEIRNLETDFRASDGSQVTVLLSSHVITVNAEKCSLSVARDFTERKVAERELSKYRSQLEELVSERTNALQRANQDVVAQTQFIRMMADSLPSMISYWTSSLHCGFANQAYGSWSGISTEKLPGMHVRDVLGDAHFERIQPLMLAALRGETLHLQRRLAIAGGPDRYFAVQYLPHRVQDTVQGVYVLAEDITDLKVTELKLTESNHQLLEQVKVAEVANQAKSRFLANMSHEIRTPMNGIVGMIDILQTTSMNHEQHRMLGTVHVSALSLLNILNDILDFSKIEAGKLAMELLPTQLRQLAEGVTLLMHTAAQVKELRLSVFIDPGLPHWFLTDPTRLRQVLLNLLGNAIKFTSARDGKQGEVTLNVSGCTLPDGTAGVELRVRDTGIGMSPQSLDKLFQPFVQADASTARRFGGTGLGLSITHRLVEMLGGHIGVTSTPGQGSDFSVQLPMQACAPGPELESQHDSDTERKAVLPNTSGPEPTTSNNGLILLAEDNETNRDVMRQQLALLGYAVEEAHDGAIALNMWRSGRYRLLLTDCEMPNLDGFGLSDAIRREEPAGTRMAIIAVTANAMQGEAQRCKDHGMDDYLTKPLRLHALAEMLGKWLPIAGPQGPRGPLPPPADAATEPALWDSTVLTQMIGDNPAMQARLLSRFLELTRCQLTDLVTAVAAADLQAITAEAHKLKSASRSVGAMTLGDLSDRIEAAGRSNDGKTCIELAVGLQATFAEVEALIQLHLSPQGQ
jgi:PAS domain S-box-containing protein